MVNNIYDIFISYRRDCSEANAKILQLELEKRGYRVFLDYVGLNTNEPFPDRIRKAIEQAPIFILMLAPNTLDRCTDEKDFLRLEIEHAISTDRVIISVNQDRLFKDFPPTCPPILKDKLGLHNFAEIFTGQQYDSTVNHLVEHRIAPVVGIRKKREEEVEGAEINLHSDLDCRVYKYGEEWCDVKQKEFKLKKLRKGQHILRFVSNENNNDYYEILYEVKNNEDIKYLSISLLPIKEKREKEEKRKSGNMWKEKLGAIGTNLKNDILVNKRLFSKLAIVLSIIAMTLGLIYNNEFFSREGSGEYIEFEEEVLIEEIAAEVVEAVESNSSYVNGHEYVDLGLPSGLKWATCNVGAESPEDFGDYFAWGEIVTKKNYSWNTYMFDEVVFDNNIILDPKSDVAIVNWGGSWRMPTDAEMIELQEKCKWTWTAQNGVQGYKIIGLSGGSIFLPAAGRKVGENIDGKGLCCYYWSSSGSNDVFNSDLPYLHYSGKEWCNGHSVRPVCP